MAAGDGRQVGIPVRRGPVFELPPFPDAVSDWGSDLVRIVDPAGRAVAWIDPGSARCVEFMVQLRDQGQTTWRSVFAARFAPDLHDTDPRIAEFGVLTVLDASGSRIMRAGLGDDWSPAEWSLLQRDPTSVVLHAALPEEEDADGGNAYARFVAQLDDATLSLFLTVQNDTAVALPVVFGFRGIFPHGLEIESAVAPVVTTDTVDASHVVVACDEEVCWRDSGPGRGGGNLSLVMLGSSPGQPVVVLPGAQEQLAISLSVFCDVEGRTEILCLRAQDGR